MTERPTADRGSSAGLVSSSSPARKQRGNFGPAVAVPNGWRERAAVLGGARKEGDGGHAAMKLPVLLWTEGWRFSEPAGYRPHLVEVGEGVLVDEARLPHFLNQLLDEHPEGQRLRKEAAKQLPSMAGRGPRRRRLRLRLRQSNGRNGRSVRLSPSNGYWLNVSPTILRRALRSFDGGARLMRSTERCWPGRRPAGRCGRSGR